MISSPLYRMSVLIIAHRFSLGFGGVPESILMLGRELGRLGIRTDVLAKDGLVRAAGDLEKLPSGGDRHLDDFPALADIKSYRCVIVAGSWNPQALLIGFRALRHGVRLIYTPKGNLAWAEFKRWRDLKKFPYLATIELMLLLISDRIVFSSQLEKRSSLLAPLFCRKSSVIPESFEGADLPSTRPPSSGTLRFGFMAEIAPRKGLAELIEAFIVWQKSGNVEAELHVAGEPRPGSEQYYEKIRRMVAAAPRPDKILFYGARRGHLRDDFYEAIDFFVCPTKFESFGLTPLEALWHGKPILVSRNLGVLEVISAPDVTISLGGGTPKEILNALRVAAAEQGDFSAAAFRRRMCTALDYHEKPPALLFAREIGYDDELVN
jgi:glycosyltransferase involved in cell wall biosynthesis